MAKKHKKPCPKCGNPTPCVNLYEDGYRWLACQVCWKKVERFEKIPEKETYGRVK